MGFFTALASAFALTASASASQVYTEQVGIIRQIGTDFPSITAHIIFKPCGELNSAYYPDEETILLCTEVSDDPRVADFFAAHEMGHAVLMQLVNDDSEESADEFAVVELLEHGHVEAVMNAAAWMMEQPDQEHGADDEHPGFAYREFNLLCMMDGYLNVRPNPACRMLWLGTEYRWKSRLALDKIRTRLSELDVAF